MRPMRVFLVGDDAWDWFLIGHDELAKYGATPDQVLYAQASPDNRD